MKFSELTREQRELFDDQIKHCHIILDQGGKPPAICTARKWLITDSALPQLWSLKSTQATGERGINWALALTIFSVLSVIKLIYFH